MGNNCEACNEETTDNARDKFRLSATKKEVLDIPSLMNSSRRQQETHIDPPPQIKNSKILKRSNDSFKNSDEPENYEPENSSKPQKDLKQSILIKKEIKTPLRAAENTSELQQIEDSIVNKLKREEEIIKDVIEIKEGVVYSGTLLNGLFHENGIVKWEDGTTLQGNFIFGKLNRKKNVKIEFEDGKKFEGEVEDFKANGFGRVEYVNGSYYEGNFREDMPHGKGKNGQSNGSYYEGNFSRGQKSGKGKFYFGESGMYEGEFRNNLFHGRGILVLNDGRVYEGEWTEGKLSGKCNVKYSNNDRYVGILQDYMKHGEGVYYYHDGRSWSGEWKNDKQSGFGLYVDAKKNEIEGVWANGRRVNEENFRKGQRSDIKFS